MSAWVSGINWHLSLCIGFRAIFNLFIFSRKMSSEFGPELISAYRRFGRGDFAFCLLALSSAGKFIYPIAVTSIKCHCSGSSVEWRPAILQESSRPTVSDWTCWDMQPHGLNNWRFWAFLLSDSYFWTTETTFYKFFSFRKLWLMHYCKADLKRSY